MQFPRVGVAAGAVPADHLDLRMLAQPGGQTLTLATVEEVDGAVGRHIDKQRAVVTAPAEGEVVHPNTSTCLSSGSGRARTSRSSVSLPAVRPSRAARRAPALPASASPIWASIPRSSGV